MTTGDGQIRKFLSCNDTLPGSAVINTGFSSNRPGRVVARFIPLGTVSRSVSLTKRAVTVLGRRFNKGIASIRFGTPGDLGSVSFSICKVIGAGFREVVISATCIRGFSMREDAISTGGASVMALCSANTSAGGVLKGLNVPVFGRQVVSSAAVLLSGGCLRILLRGTPCLMTVTARGVSSLTPDSFLRACARRCHDVPTPTGRPAVNIVSALFSREICFNG